MSTETYKTIDKLVRKWSYLFNLDDHHAGKLRKSLENRAECLEWKYDPNQCGNYEGYIASCLTKFAGCDASRAKDGVTKITDIVVSETDGGQQITCQLSAAVGVPKGTHKVRLASPFSIYGSVFGIVVTIR